MNEKYQINEDDLHAFVDERLDKKRYSEVVAYLAIHPVDAARIEAWRAQRQQLRDALAPVTDETLPAELDLQRMLKSQISRRKWYKQHLSYWVMSAAASLFLLLGGMSGWMLRDMENSTKLMTLGQEAIASYNVYAFDRLRPVELRAEEAPLLAQWVQESIGSPVGIPELTADGYHFMGGRIVAGAQGAAILLMYDNDRGTRLVMMAQPMPERADSTMDGVSTGNIHGFVWSDRGFGYSLVGALPAQKLHPLANAIRQQIKTL